MPELGEGWGATVQGSVAGAKAILQDERKNYLAYLEERTKQAPDADPYAELVELTDRGLMDPDDLMLDNLNIQAEYTSSFQQTIGGQGGIAVAIGPANINASGSLTQTNQSNANLRISATYRQRSRADFLQQTLNTLPPRAAVDASKPKPTPAKP